MNLCKKFTIQNIEVLRFIHTVQTLKMRQFTKIPFLQNNFDKIKLHNQVIGNNNQSDIKAKLPSYVVALKLLAGSKKLDGFLVTRCHLTFFGARLTGSEHDRK